MSGFPFTDFPKSGRKINIRRGLNSRHVVIGFDYFDYLPVWRLPAKLAVLLRWPSQNPSSKIFESFWIYHRVMALYFLLAQHLKNNLFVFI